VRLLPSAHARANEAHYAFCSARRAGTDAELMAFGTVHVRDVKRARLVKTIDALMDARDFERVDPEDAAAEPELVRIQLESTGRWIALAVEDDDQPATWAEALSKALATTALAAWHWDDESVTSVTLFEKGEEIGGVSLPTDARKVAPEKLTVALGKLSRLVGDGSHEDGLELRFATSPREDDLVYVDLADAERVFRKAFGIGPLIVDAEDEGPSLVYRERGAAERERTYARAARLEAHHARVYAAGWAAFEAKPTELARLVDAFAKPLADTFAPYVGPQSLDARTVDPAKGYREETLPPPDDAAWKQYVSLLSKGSMIELRPKRLLSSLCLVFHDGALAITWSIRALKDEAKRRALADMMDDLVRRAAADERCFGAVVLAQASALVLEQRAFAWEYLHDASAHALQTSWQRTHARAPGWRLVVPTNTKLPAKPPARFTKRGRLLASSESDPWAVGPADIDAIEAYLSAAQTDLRLDR
jgi:hypothetical protein